MSREATLAMIRASFSEGVAQGVINEERNKMLSAGAATPDPYEPLAKPHWCDLVRWADDGGPQP